jgi:hypothetical protein
MRPVLWWLVVLSWMPVQEAAADDERVPITVVVTGDRRLEGSVRRALREESELPLEVRFAELPNAPAASGERIDFEEIASRARASYIEADFAACRRAVEDDRRITRLLAAGNRSAASRLLFWRIACLVGAGDEAGAEREALRFAVLGLDAPPDVSAATPEVEAALGTAYRAVEEMERVSLRVRADAPRASVSVDGRSDLCVSPCAVDVPPGDHVIRVSADGRQSAERSVRVEAGGAEARFELDEAPPGLAAVQWTQRYATSTEVDSAASVDLLAHATRARRFVLLSADGVGEGARLRGVLAVDGSVSARSEQTSEDATDISELTDEVLSELLVEGEVLEPAPGLFARPLFWIILGVVVAGAVTATVLLLQEPDTRTRVVF